MRIIIQFRPEFSDRKNWEFLKFDSIGVPSTEEMIKEAMGLYLEDADDNEIEQGSIHKDRFLIPVEVSTT